jgi:hypothetical protein
VSGAWAQEKYEYAIVRLEVYGRMEQRISISKANSFEQIQVKIVEGDPYSNQKDFIQLIEKMNKEGWEVFSTNIPGLQVQNVYQLRKKKTN